MLLNKQQLAVMVIGQQLSGKTQLIKKFTASAGLSKTILVDGEEYDFEVMDSPAYDSFFTMLPMSSKSISGYVMVFSMYNSSVVACLKEIREKLFQINGLHKPLVVVHNVIGQNSLELANVTEYCTQEGLLLMSVNILSAEDNEINCIFETLIENRKPKQRYWLYGAQLASAICLLAFGIIFIIINPDLFLRLNVEWLLLNCLVIGIMRMVETAFAYFASDSTGLQLKRTKYLAAADSILSVLFIVQSALIEVPIVILPASLNCLWSLIALVFIIRI